MAEGGGGDGLGGAQELTSVLARSSPAVSAQRSSLSLSRPRPIVNGKGCATVCVGLFFLYIKLFLVSFVSLLSFLLVTMINF